MKLKGSIVALITPFYEDGSVNFEKLGELLEWHVTHKTDGILILGTTGESSTMTHEEDDAVCAYTIEKIAKRIPVIVGSGSNCTQTAIEKSLKYEAMGADALLVITPYYNKANEAGMIAHFEAVANAVHTPIIMYNIPGRCGCELSVTAVAHLSKHPNICGIKEASGNIAYAVSIARYLNDDFAMYSGNDDMITPLMSVGASGVISVVANILPEMTHSMVRRYLDHDVQGSLDLQLQYLDVIHALFYEVNPIPIKAAMNLMGMQVGEYRLPLFPMSDANHQRLQDAMQKAGLL